MNKIIITLLIYANMVYAKSYGINLHIQNIPLNQDITLSFKDISQKKFIEINSLKTKDGNIKFHLNDDSKIGIYRIKSVIFDIEVIFDKEDISLDTTYLTAKKNMKVIKSYENKQFYKLIDLYTNHEAKRISLTKMLNLYSVHDKFYTIILDELNKINTNTLEKFRKSIPKDKKLKNSFLAKLLKK